MSTASKTNNGKSEYSNRSISKSSKSGKSQKREKNNNKKTKQPVDGIRLIHSSGEIIVKEQDIVNVSSLMKIRQEENRLVKAIALQDFTYDCVLLLAEYIQKRQLKTTISFYTMAEVIKLAKAFGIAELHKKIEEALVNAARRSGENLLQALLVNDVAPISRETEIQLHYFGAWRFMDLVRQSNFHKLPPGQFLQIFASCELNVAHELSAVDGALFWLAGQSKLEILAPAVFSLIRSAYLGKVERQMIIERCSVLNFPETTIRILKVLLDSRHNYRICLIPEHIQRNLPRCGIAEAARRVPETTLPLSRPREGLIRPKKENLTKGEKLKTEKSGSSSQSKKSSNSQKSIKSGMCKRSHKSEMWQKKSNNDKNNLKSSNV